MADIYPPDLTTKFAPNTSYLLKFYSADTQPQDIAARIEFYDGVLDVPNGDLD